MVDTTSNDNEPIGSPYSSDPHSHAALLLVESLIHELIARSIFSVSDAIALVNVAIDATAEIAEDQRDIAATMTRSIVLLQAISTSLEIDRL